MSAQNPSVPVPGAPPAPKPPAPSTSRPPETLRADLAHIGKSVIIKGELSGSEDLYLDGEVEGGVQLRQHSLTVGPNGKVKGNINAREVVLLGKVDGNVRGDERVELKRSAVLVGDIATARISIEDGAFFKGGIDIAKEAKSESKRDSSTGSSSVASSLGSYAASPYDPSKA